MRLTNGLKQYVKRLLNIVPWQNDLKLQSKRISQYFNITKTRKLQLGCGPNFLEGWLNTDIYRGNDSVVYLDVTKPFPIPDETFSYITSEHLIEHITFDQSADLLKECYRILIPNGKIRITTPDLETIIKLYNYNSQPQKEYIDHIIKEFLPNVNYNPEVFVINNAFRNWGHQFLYNKSTLSNLLTEVGFKNISQTLPGMSEDPNFTNIDMRNLSKWKKINEFEIIVLEATKP